MTRRLMTDAERTEIAAIEARAKARFDRAWHDNFIYRPAQGIEAQRDETPQAAQPEGQEPGPERDAPQ